MRTLTHCAAAVLLVLGLLTSGQAFMDDPEVGPLRGAPRTLHIVIGDLGPDAATGGLTAERLFGTVAAQLTAAGFQVEDAAPAAIHVELGLSPVRGAGLVAYSLRYSFDQPVRLERDRKELLTAPTWLVVHTGTAFSAKLANSVLAAAGRAGERFLNNFDAINPPGG